MVISCVVVAAALLAVLLFLSRNQTTDGNQTNIPHAHYSLVQLKLIHALLGTHLIFLLISWLFQIPLTNEYQVLHENQ